MAVPILKQGPWLIASIQSALTDTCHDNTPSRAWASALTASARTTRRAPCGSELG